MPASLLANLAAWLATHLVALCLLGFLVVGLFVFGVFGPRGDPVAWPDRSTDVRPTPKEAVPRAKDPAQAPAGPDDARFRPPDVAVSNPDAGPGQGRGERLQQARRAYWNGDIDGAEAGYLDAIVAAPDDADLFGELGNLYLATGRPAWACDAYFAAGVRLKVAGRREKLSKVIEILREHDDPRSLELAP